MKQLNLEIPDHVFKLLEQLRRLSECKTNTEVIARALAVYEFCCLRISDGGKIIHRMADGTEHEVELP